MCSRAPAPAAAANVHPLVAPISHILGTWTGIGNGSYPTVQPFQYFEKVTFAHNPIRPVVFYTQTTNKIVDGKPDPTTPMHSESGFFKVLPEGKLEVSMSDSIGYATTYVGLIEDTGRTLSLQSTSISGVPSAKQTSRITRVLKFSGAQLDTLNYELDMEAVGQPMQHHLDAKLTREPFAEVIPISVADFKAHPGKFAFIVDIREPDEIAAVPSIPGTNVVVPMGKLFSQGPRKEWAGQNVIFICRSGARANIMAQEWKNRGFNAFVLVGGVNAYYAQ